MGYGDWLMCSGLARGAAARGKRVAFGDGVKIRWHPHADQIFVGNPNVARPGEEKRADLEWVANYAGKRPYNRVAPGRDRWIWVSGHGNVPGEMFFGEAERASAALHGGDFVVIEPSLPPFKAVATNKQWQVSRYQEVADSLVRAGREVVQFQSPSPYGPGPVLRGVRQIRVSTFRSALAVLARASLYVGPEGGLHHGAAAVRVPAVVIFGGFISPEITGYASHRNFFVGESGCGVLSPCDHCRRALDAITADEVTAAAMEELSVSGKS